MWGCRRQRGVVPLETVCALKIPSVQSGRSPLWVWLLFHSETCLHICWEVIENIIFGISIQREGPGIQGSQSFSLHRAVTPEGPSGGLGQRGLLVSPGWPSSPAFVCVFGHLFTPLDCTPSPHCTGFCSVLPKWRSFGSEKAVRPCGRLVLSNEP